MIALHTRAACDECGRPAVVEDEPLVFLCERCKINSISSAGPLVDGNASTDAVHTPAPALVDANNSSPMRSPAFPPNASATLGASASSLSLDDPRLEAAVCALEVQFLRTCIVLNNVTSFANRAIDARRDNAASSDISNSSSVGA